MFANNSNVSIKIKFEIFNSINYCENIHDDDVSNSIDMRSITPNKCILEMILR